MYKRSFATAANAFDALPPRCKCTRLNNNYNTPKTYYGKTIVTLCTARAWVLSSSRITRVHAQPPPRLFHRGKSARASAVGGCQWRISTRAKVTTRRTTGCETAKTYLSAISVPDLGKPLQHGSENNDCRSRATGLGSR